MRSINSRLKLGLILFGVFALAIFYVLNLKSPKPAPFITIKAAQIHYANKPEILLKTLSIYAVYFVPDDQTGQPNSIWQQAVNKSLGDISGFYAKQLGEGLKINYKIYPVPVTGQFPTLYYDGADTGGGNPHALNAIRQELSARLFATTGNLYRKDFTAEQQNFNVLAIFYEGVGGGATLADESGAAKNSNNPSDQLPALLLARSFLTDENYQDYGTTFLAHEFGHILGLQDSYDLITGQPFSDDIMGSGRFRPLLYTYISQKDKQALGINP